MLHQQEPTFSSFPFAKHRIVARPAKWDWEPVKPSQVDKNEEDKKDENDEAKSPSADGPAAPTAAEKDGDKETSPPPVGQIKQSEDRWVQ